MSLTLREGKEWLKWASKRFKQPHDFDPSESNDLDMVEGKNFCFAKPIDAVVIYINPDSPNLDMMRFKINGDDWCLRLRGNILCIPQFSKQTDYQDYLREEYPGNWIFPEGVWASSSWWMHYELRQIIKKLIGQGIIELVDSRPDQP